MTLIQTHLVNGNRNLITWIPTDKRIKVGSIISLDKEVERWRVEELFSIVDSENIQRGWGLDLPKNSRTEI